MNKKNTLIVFYTGVAVICLGILYLVNFVVLPNIRERKAAAAEVFQNQGKVTVEEFYPIKKDLVATNQAGTEVRLSDLRGKVIVIAEFFAVCPSCAARNGNDLKALNEKFKDDPNFHIVCVSIDPEEDNVERLKLYAESLGADINRWWFLNGGTNEMTHEYMEKTLGFMKVSKWQTTEEIESKGKYNHDMGLMVVNKDFNVVGKWQLFDAKSEEGRKRDPGMYERLKDQMLRKIEEELTKDKSDE